MATPMSFKSSTDMVLSSSVPWEKAAHLTQGTTSKQTTIKCRCVYCSQDGDSGHSWSSRVRVRVHLEIERCVGGAGGCYDAIAANKFKAFIREAAAKAAQKASLKRARKNVDNPAPSPAP